LAQAIARDGEGATKFVTITVKSAPGFGEAKQVALAIAHSPLVKTALYGQDANWGRVLSAVGYSGVAVQPERLALWFGSPEDNGPPLQLVKDGRPYDVDEARAAAILAHHDVDITVDLGLGGAEATVWTCDLSHDYVSINAHYRT
jgi:glutamate N-acetyltransferase/amino-acid N-acetyltransferase